MEERKKTAREIIEGYDGPAVRIMEVCGTHTHEIFRLGIRKLLPKQVELISGPGCPVCVTPVSYIDEAVYLALEKSVTICTFGDLVRVPGSKKSLADARSEGGKIHIVYSPADAEKYAKEHPEEEVVFLSVGFETTTPAGCLSVKKAKEEGITNYSMLIANKTMPQAYEALKGSADIFLYPGHVNAITGSTGAGVKPSSTSHFSWRNDNISIYKPFTHQHLAEINQSLSQLQKSYSSRINFIPVRGNFSRGIFATTYIDCKIDLVEIRRIYEEYYDDHSFTFITDKNPDLKQVVNTNKCLIHLQKIDDKLLIISMIDNLLKGASGQAVHNMNLLFGLEETVGLHLKPSAF